MAHLASKRYFTNGAGCIAAPSAVGSQHPLDFIGAGSRPVFSKDEGQLRHSALQLIGRSYDRAFLETILDDLDTMLAQYVRAQLLLSLFGFMAYAVFLLIMRFPYALAVAAIGGVLEFIPFVGPLLTLGMPSLSPSCPGIPHWIAVIVFWLVWRGVQDYVNTPRVMGKRPGPSSPACDLRHSGRRRNRGVLGVFLSIPTVGALRVLWFNWTTPDGDT